MTKEKDYKCSKHGNIGHPECSECCKNLKRLCADNNVYISATKEDKLKMGLN